MLSANNLAERASELAASGRKVAVLCRGPELGSLPPGVTQILLPAADSDLARVLYAVLRQVDELGCDVALATLPAETGLGTAIADRLRKAAGPRTANSRGNG